MPVTLESGINEILIYEIRYDDEIVVYEISYSEPPPEPSPEPPPPPPEAPPPPPEEVYPYPSVNEIALFLRSSPQETAVLFVPLATETSPGVVVLPTRENPYSLYGQTPLPNVGQRNVPDSVRLLHLVPSVGYRVNYWRVSVIGKQGTDVVSVPVASGTGETVSLENLPQIISQNNLTEPFFVVVEVSNGSVTLETYQGNEWITSSETILVVPTGEFVPFEFTWSFRYQTGVFLAFGQGRFSFRYIAGITTPTILHYQRYRIPEETWDLVYQTPYREGTNTIFTDLSYYLSFGKLRFFRVKGGKAYFLIVTHSPPYSVYYVVVDVDPSSPTYKQVTLRSIQPLMCDGDDVSKKRYPTFGSVAEGHGGFVFVTHKDAIYFPYDTDSEILRVSLISDQYPLPSQYWGIKSVLVVPEGFLFLPEGILWDMETYWNFKVEDEGTLNENERILPFYTENFIGFVVRRGEFENNPSDQLARAYVWNGVTGGLVKIRLDSGDNQPIPFYLGGSQMGQWWVAFTAHDHFEESVIVAHKVVLDENNPSDLTKAKFSLAWKGRTLPLPFSSPVRQAGLPPGWWEVWLFSTVVLNNMIYFGRLWERIYKYNPQDQSVVLAHVFPSVLPDGSLAYLTEEEAGALFLSLDETSGKLYGCKVVGNYVQIWRQRYSYTPPNPPTILFPTPDLAVPRRFEVIFRPSVDERPQDFAVEITAQRTDTGQRMTLYYDSRLHRSLFSVSTDGGTNYTPMTGPITVTSGNQPNLRVKFSLPTDIPPSLRVTIKVYSIVPTP